MNFWHTWLTCLLKDKEIAQIQKPKGKSIKVYLQKKTIFFSNFCYDEQMAVVTTLKGTPRLTLFFWLKVQTSLKQCPKLQKKGFTQKFPRIGRLQFWQIGQTYSLKLTKSIRSESWKKLQFFLLQKVFPQFVPKDTYCRFANPKKILRHCS